MKVTFTKLFLALFVSIAVSGCATTNSNQFACDFFDAADNNIEISDGRDQYGDTSKTDKSNFVFDSAIGFISATGKAIGRAFSSKEEVVREKCV